MSRIGRLPIAIPAGVAVTIKDNQVTVKGPKGELSQSFVGGMAIKLEDNKLTVSRPSDSKQNKALHGLTRALLNNMVTGVTQGWEKSLEIVGVGYRAEVQGSALSFNLGYSHPIRFPLPEGIKAEVERQTRITLRGVDKHLLGLTAAKIRSLRPPEPYGGKGIKYLEEVIHRKAGKTVVG